MSPLRTRRLLLRCPQAGDGAQVYAAVLETLAQLRAWPAALPWAMQTPSLAASEDFCQASAQAFAQRSALVYLAFEESGTLVGCASLHAIDWALPKFELGFWCRSSRQGQGLTSEAAAELLRYAFASLGARRVEAITDEANAGSRAVCAKLGMQLERIVRNERSTPGGPLRSRCVYATTRATASA